MLVLLLIGLNCGTVVGYFLYKNFRKGVPQNDTLDSKGVDRAFAIFVGTIIGVAAGVLFYLVLFIIRLLISNPSYILWIS